MASPFPPQPQPIAPGAGAPITPRKVEASAAAAWWTAGWRIFAAGIGKWFGIVIVYFLLSGLLSGVPYIGLFAQWLLGPVFLGGIMLGCAAIDRGEPLRFTHLFDGFKEPHFIPLMIIGAINMGLAFAIVVIGFAGVAGSIGLSALMGAGNPNFDPYTLWESMGFGILFGILAVLVLVTVMAMVNWFAPALIVLHGAKPVDAMKASFRACMRNWIPFLVYGAIGILIGTAVMIVFGVAFASLGLSVVFGAGDAWATKAIGGVIALGLLCLAVGLVATPVVFGSSYAGYRDMFAPDGADDEAAAPR
jgi:hypothetical protein